MNTQALARKWRPQNFENMVGQEPILRMLTNALTHQRLHHAYLFTGTRGVGKTTLARLLAKALNCETGITATPCGTCNTCVAITQGRFLDLIEVDAASRTKVEDTRDLLENVQYPPVQGRFKIYLIDEVHMLSNHSFNALLKTLEEPPPHIKFLLATTDPKRLPITVLSRCLQLNLKRVPEECICQQLQHICLAENIHYEQAALEKLAQAADGSMRDALSLLDQAIAFGGDTINLKETLIMLGSIEQDAILRLLDALATHDGKKLIAEVASLADYAPDFTQILEEILHLLHQISRIQIVKSTASTALQSLAHRFTAEETQLFYQIALIGRRDLAFAPSPASAFEMIMLRMLAFKPAMDTETLFENKTSTTPATKTESTWPELISKLELTGLALALANNCTLTKITDNQVELTLSNKHEAMLNKKLSDRIEQALTQYYKKPMQLTIHLTSDTLLTPQKQQEEQQQQRQASATEAIKNDSHVKKIMDIFNATLDTNSVKAIDPT